RMIQRLNPWSSLHALDFRCPDPIWRETADRSIILAAEGGGWTLPETLPESWSATTGERTLLNPGDVDTPFKVRFYGAQTGGRLESSVATLPTEVIRLRGTVASGSYVEVDTGVDGLTVERVTDGERTNALGMFDFDAGDFFELLPQTLHTLRWSADSATGPTFADQSLALTGGFASAPSHAGLDVTGDLDVRA